MNHWKQLLPKNIKINQLSLEECRHFKQFYELLTQEVLGPPGYRLFYQFLHHLLFYMLCCIQEQKFPALNKAWHELSTLFATPEYDNEWLLYCWLCCDFPLESDNKAVLIDYFAAFILRETTLPVGYAQHLQQFCTIMKQSRLGLYQEILSTSNITKFREFFTHHVISTIRSVPEYESGEIFLTRIVFYLGDHFQLHHPQCYPPEFKQSVMDMVNKKLPLVANTSVQAQDYELFMKLAGPYWMSCTHPNSSISIFSPDHYKTYY